MRERRAEILVLLFVILLPLFVPTIAHAEWVSTSATVLNSAPTVTILDLSPDDDSESPGVQVITPDPSTKKSVIISVTVRDNNGWDDIATVTVEITGPSVIAESPLNVAFESASNITTARYNGSFNLSEHAEGTYNLTVTAKDADGLTGSATTTFTYCYTTKVAYAIWGNSTTQKRTIDWLGSKDEVIGSVHSNNDLRVSGSKNTFLGTTEYVSDFIDSGSKNVFASPPIQVAPRPIPVHYDATDYAPGGSRAIAAEAAGKYHYINGEFIVSDSDTVLDGLYYVRGRAKLSGERLSGVFTIVAEQDIGVSSSGHHCTAYMADLLFMSNNGTEKSGITMAVNDGTFYGNTYTENGVIAVSGAKNTINGGLFGDTIELSTTESILTALAPENAGSQPPLTPPLGDTGIIDVIKAVLHFFG